MLETQAIQLNKNQDSFASVGEPGKENYEPEDIETQYCDGAESKAHLHHQTLRGMVAEVSRTDVIRHTRPGFSVDNFNRHMFPDNKIYHTCETEYISAIFPFRPLIVLNPLVSPVQAILSRKSGRAKALLESSTSCGENGGRREGYRTDVKKKAKSTAPGEQSAG
jgi:hypothetical protein